MGADASGVASAKSIASAVSGIASPIAGFIGAFAVTEMSAGASGSAASGAVSCVKSPPDRQNGKASRGAVAKWLVLKVRVFTISEAISGNVKTILKVHSVQKYNTRTRIQDYSSSSTRMYRLCPIMLDKPATESSCNIRCGFFGQK